MSNFVIFTDNAADIPVSTIKDLQLERIMIEFRLKSGEEMLKDPDDIDEFYRLLDIKNRPSTSAANTPQFIEKFTPHLEAGNDIFYFGLMHGLSVTIEAAWRASEELTKQYPARRIVCIDSRCASAGIGYLATNAAKMRLAGHSLDQVIDYVETTKMGIVHDFTVDKLDYLHAGGRVSKLQQVAGELLGICPVLHVDYAADKDGSGEFKDRLLPRDKIRGKKVVLRTMADRVAQNIKFADGTIIVAYGDCQPKAAEFAELIRHRLPNAQIMFSRVGGVIGTHTGPTILGAFYEGHKR